MPADARVDGVPLPGDVDVDVAIVGAGLTGLWTAYYLASADRGLRIAVLERERVGFGASGRNGGWCSGLLAAGIGRLASRHGRTTAIAMQRQLFGAVDEIGRVVEAERLDAQYAKGGTITAARTAAQQQRLVDDLAEARSFGFGNDDLRWLEPDELLRALPDGRLASCPVHAALRGGAPDAARARRRGRGLPSRGRAARPDARRRDRPGRSGHRARHGCAPRSWWWPRRPTPQCCRDGAATSSRCTP